MTNAAEILRLIEAAHPDDTTWLAEIDGRVWAFIKGYVVEKIGLTDMGCDGYVELKTKEDGYRNVTRDIPRYTRSRNALKTIRPNNFHTFNLEIDPDGCSATTWIVIRRFKDGRPANLKYFHCPKVGSEELAELHTILQAVAYERERSLKAA